MSKSRCLGHSNSSQGTERERALRKIAVGDIFHASAPVTASYICLTLEVTKDTIRARRVTTQTEHEFDRATGIEGPEDNPTIIDSVAPLPADIHEIMLSLDRKYGAKDPPKLFSEEARLTKEQQRGLLFVADFYPEHPI